MLTPFRIDNCTSSDKWTSDTYSKTLTWEERCVTIEEKPTSRFLFYTTCPSSNNTVTKWKFQYILKNDLLPQQIIPKIKSLTQRRFRAKHTKSENQKQNKDSQQQSSKRDPTKRNKTQQKYKRIN